MAAGDLDYRFSGRDRRPRVDAGLASSSIPGSDRSCCSAPASRWKVEGTIDEVPFASRTSMPTGRGIHFLSVSAALRKKLGKGAGDPVEVHLTKTPHLDTHLTPRDTTPA